MQSGNGIDIAAIHQLLTEVARRVGFIETRLGSVEAASNRHDAKLNEAISAINSHTRQMDELAGVVNAQSSKIDDLDAGLTELRKTVHEYHHAVVGHGIELTRLDERIGRIENHLNLDRIES